MTTPPHPPTDAARPAPRPRRGSLTRFLEVRGVLGGHAVPHSGVRLRSVDGVRLAASYLPGPAAAAPAVVLAHGFAASGAKPAYALLADRLAGFAHVLALDLRGHGRSGGASTLGDREALDVAAGVAWLRAFGHDWVAAMGLSMGATAVLHACWQAGRQGAGAAADAAVLVSAPAWFRDEPETLAMRRLKSAWETPWKRHAMRMALGVRLVAPATWSSPPQPVELVRAVGAPLLVVHGEDDAYFPPTDGQALAAAAPPPAALWLEPAGFGHAEDGLRPDFVDDVGRAILVARRDGAFPVTRSTVRP